MSDCKDHKNPLQHSGTNQFQRFLPGLKPGYVKIDEHDYADWIVFAAEFSRYIHYVNLNGLNTNNWTAFFASDLSAVLGGIAIQNVERYRLEIKQLFDYLKDDKNTANTDDLKLSVYKLFSGLFTLAKTFDSYYDTLPESYPIEETSLKSISKDGSLKGVLFNLIKTKLKPAIDRLLLYYHEADQAFNFSSDVLFDQDFSAWKALNRHVEAAASIIDGSGYGEVWRGNSHASWEDYRQAIYAQPQTQVFVDPNVDGSVDPQLAVFLNIAHAANHNLFASVFDTFIQVYQKFVDLAEVHLLITLENWPFHAPHYALFLGFLKLYRKNVDQLNKLTDRHLDYYYKDILRFKKIEARPNQIHLIVELAKSLNSYALAKGTLFKAGKDSLGNEILYSLDAETTFNKAKIAALKSIYFGDANDNYTYTQEGATISVNNLGRLFASPIANSADGIGGKLMTPAQEWPLFTSYLYENNAIRDVLAPNASIGFAVASHYLFLAEGERIIKLRLATSDNAACASLSAKAYLTTSEGWFEVDQSMVSITQSTLSNTEACVELELSLSGSDPEITAYDAKVHEKTYGVDTPVLLIELKNADDVPYQYNNFRDITFSAFELKVEVGMSQAGYTQKGLKNLNITADTGAVDASKPFLPFGAQPQKDAGLVIGSQEAFSKPNARLKLNLEWAGIVQSKSDMDFDAAGGDDMPNVQLDFLDEGEWTNKKPNGVSISDFQLFTTSGDKVLSTFSKDIPASWIKENVFINYNEELGSYGPGSLGGFLRLSLLEGFGHKDYTEAYSVFLINKANKITPNPKPVEPYTPKLKSVFLSYEAHTGVVDLSDSQSLQQPIGRFFHVYPFGQAEQHQALFSEPGDVYLMPQFTHTDNKAESTDTPPVQSRKHYHIGEFYIGIESLLAQESVNILFQVMEGTTDPLVSKPENHVAWSYLAGNEWKNFDDLDVVDRTNQLIQSGIISFAIPSDATTSNSMMPASYLWLRASVSEAADALGKLITIQAQAAQATLSSNNYASEVYEHAMPASSISKLKLPQAEIKKIQQPFSSFGGRAEETPEKFYVRVSERMRHRDRASAIWDYEHLVLEAFPSIYKVKCLNHTKVVDSDLASERIYNENQPGYVTVITIPSLVNRNDTDRLKPYTHQSMLKQIKDYLQQRISPHVNLAVENPLFEDVKTSLKLKLKPAYSNFVYYANLLREEITQFLSPWVKNNDAEIEFGGKLYKSTLINFIEERPYVEFITDMKLKHRVDAFSSFSDDAEEVSASTARSVLVSVEAGEHEIIQYEDDLKAENLECV